MQAANKQTAETKDARDKEVSALMTTVHNLSEAQARSPEVETDAEAEENPAKEWLRMVGGQLSETSHMKAIAHKYFSSPKEKMVKFRFWRQYDELSDPSQRYVTKHVSSSTKVRELVVYAQQGMQQPDVAVGLYRSNYEGEPCTQEEEWEWLYEGGAMTSLINPKNGQLLRGDLTIGEQLLSDEDKLVFKPISPETFKQYGY